jgi:UDP-2,3-diacylglucosamine pyrophosphatase LpxH
MVKNYYFISDLHIGGDGPLNDVHFDKELIFFLKKIEKENDVELIIVGDFFGFWEMSMNSGLKKLEYILKTHKKIFNQFKKTGSKIKITLIPGNHDYDLVTDEKFKKILKEYNINLEQKQFITRTINGKKIWIEHGNQQDEPNAIIPFGDKTFKPFGFYATQKLLISAGNSAEVAKHPWLRDLESVFPYESIPKWLFSNYFYKEMSPLLRYSLLPFILMISLSFLILVFFILQILGFFPGVPVYEHLLRFGIFGWVILLIILVDVLLILSFLFISIPLKLIKRDLKRTLTRYKVIGDEGIKREKFNIIKKYVKEKFKKENVDIFVTGHTHTAFIETFDRKVLINTGTWLKKVVRIKSRYKFLPNVYYPVFELSYFKIYADKKKVAIAYNKIPKKIDKLGLTFLERLVIFLRKKTIKQDEIPDVFYV